jgi:hypothetical protein
LARAVRVREVTNSREWPGFDESLKISDSQPASLASIGNSIDAATAAATMRRQRRTPMPAFANVLPDDGNPHLTQSDSLRAQP